MKKAINQSVVFIIISSVALAIIALALLFVSNLSRAGVDFEKAAADRFYLTKNANRFMDGSAYLTSEVRSFAATGNITHYNNYWNEINNLKNRDIGVENMREIGITAEEEAMIQAMANLSNNLVPLEDYAMQLTQAGEREQAMELVFGADYERTIGQIRAIRDQFLASLDARAAGAAEAERESQAALITPVAITMTAVGVIQLFSIIIIVMTIILPVKKLQKEMECIAKGDLSSVLKLTPNTSEIGRLVWAVSEIKNTLRQYITDIAEKLESMAEGNFDVSVDIDYIGEFVPIKASLETILESLNDSLRQINNASAQVSAGAKQITDDSQSLAQGSTEQAASVQQLSGSISEIADKTKENAQMADKAASLASDIMNNAEKGSKQMEEMMSAVNDINTASQNISKVIKVIDDIAFQTNILALNAAVEAARAGQHGKGFAVVAEEVRNLAAKSAEAAKETGEMIQNSIEKAALGSRIAGETAESLTEIVSGINESTALIKDIAKSSEEQSVGISQINQGIDQVAQVIQQNSATAQQSAASSEEMSGQSDMLEEMISRFKLKR